MKDSLGADAHFYSAWWDCENAWSFTAKFDVWEINEVHGAWPLIPYENATSILPPIFVFSKENIFKISERISIIHKIVLKKQRNRRKVIRFGPQIAQIFFWVLFRTVQTVNGSKIQQKTTKNSLKDHLKILVFKAYAIESWFNQYTLKAKWAQIPIEKRLLLDLPTA